MERKSWSIDVDGTQHAVALNWTYWGGRREVTVDGEVVATNTLPMRWSSTQPFRLGGHEAVVRTRPSNPVSPYFVITLELDGRKMPAEPGRSGWESKKS